MRTDIRYVASGVIALAITGCAAGSPPSSTAASTSADLSVVDAWRYAISNVTTLSDIPVLIGADLRGDVEGRPFYDWTPFHVVEGLLADTTDILSIIQAEPLETGQEFVIEGLSDDVGRSVAMAGCYQGFRAIAYDRAHLRAMTRRSFRFVREHELAHHVNGDVISCAPLPPRFKVVDSLQERSADCAAVERLKRMGTIGLFSIIAAAERFYTMPVPKESVYMNNAERADLLTSGCGEGLGIDPNR